MAEFESIPKRVQAEQWFEGKDVGGVKHGLVDLGIAAFYVTTIHGQHTIVTDGDWIIHGT